MNMHLLFAHEPVAKPKFVKKHSVAYQALKQSRLDDAPYHQAQEDLEKLFDKAQLKKRVRQEFDIPELTQRYEDSGLADHDISRDFVLELCIQMVIHKRAEPSALIAILYRKMDDGYGQHHAMQRTADALELCVQANFVDYSMARKEFIVRLDVTSKVQHELDRYQYPLPMVVQPKPLRHNGQNGYVSHETGRGMPILKPGRMRDVYAQADICLDHLNRMNAIPLTLNTDVAETIDNEWSNLDRRKPNETHDQYEKRLKAFERYDDSSKDVMHAISGIRERFWLTHAYDRRGRCYCRGYHINYQGNPWNKAVIEFADKELIHD
jgi:hypothetical protein